MSALVLHPDQFGKPRVSQNSTAVARDIDHTHSTGQICHVGFNEANCPSYGPGNGSSKTPKMKWQDANRRNE